MYGYCKVFWVPTFMFEYVAARTIVYTCEPLYNETMYTTY